MSPLPVPSWARPAGPPTSSSDRGRRLVAAGLRIASVQLGRWARQLAMPVAASPAPEPRLEFYAEAGAPEGALYADGELVGRVDGVRRL